MPKRPAPVESASSYTEPATARPWTGPGTLAATAEDLLALADQLSSFTADLRVACTPAGQVLAHRYSRTAPADRLSAAQVEALVARQAAEYRATGSAVGTLAPAPNQPLPFSFSSRHVTLAGHPLLLVELSTLTPSLLAELEEARVDPADLPELLPADLVGETRQLITVIGLDGTYRAVNEVTERILGLPAARIVGRAVAQVLHLSGQELQNLDQALRLSARGTPQHLTWWYCPPHHAGAVTADVTLRGVRFAGEVAVHTVTNLLTAPHDPVHTAHLRNSQLELANFLLSTANRFQQPVKLLEFVLQQLVAKSPVVGGALYAYNAEAHRLDQLLALGADHPAGLPAHLELFSSPTTMGRLNQRKMRVADRVLTTEFALAGAPETTLAVLPVCSDEALHYVLALTLPATPQYGWITALLHLISDGLNSVVTRERLRSELATTEQRYRLLFDASADGILLTDGRHVLEANQTAATLLGYSPTELLAAPDVATLLIDPHQDPPGPGGGPPSWRELVRATRGTGAAHTFEAHLRRANGTRLTAEVRIRPVQLSGGALVQVLLRDIGERVTADEALLRAEVLRQSMRELRNLLGTLSLAYVSFDTEATILAVNDFFVELTGYAREELLGRNYFEVFVPDPAARALRIRHYYEEIFRYQRMDSHYESVICTKAGERVIMRWNRLFERDEKGQIQATISIGRDVTAGILAVEDSQRSQARFQDLFDNAHDLIQHLAPDNHFLSVNRAWHQTLGYAEADLLTLTLPDVVHPYHSAKLMHQLRALYRGEEVGQIETVLLTRDGRPVHLIGSVSAQWQDRQVVAARLILHDITERIHAERLQKAYYSIANLAISARDLDTLYGAIHRDLSRLLDTHNFFITLCDEARTRLTLAYSSDTGVAGRAVGESRPFGQGATEYIIGQGSPVLLQRRELEAMTAAGVIQLQIRIPEVLAGVPLTVGGRIIGALMLVDYTDADTYKPADLDVLYFISSQVALAIDRKRNEVQLHRQNARLNAIFESGSHLMWSVSPTRRLTAYNRNFALAFFNHDQLIHPDSARTGVLDEIGLQLDLRLVLAQNAALWEREYAAAFAGEARQFEVRTVQTDGAEAWAEIYLNPILLPDGTLEEVSGIAHDITEKKLTQLELTRQEELFRGIFEAFQDVYYRSDAHGRLVLLSPSVEANFGFKSPDLIGQTGDSFFADPATYRAFLDEMRREGQARGFEAVFQDRDGQPRDVLISARLLTTAAGERAGMEGLVMDIGPLKQVQHDLLLAKQEAELALRAKTQFLANMSHELRTPMNGIIGMIELLDHTVQTTVQGEYVDTLRRSSDALLAILNDILDLSKMQAGKLAVSLAPVDLLDVLAKVQALFANRATQKLLSFTSDVAPDVPRFVETDEIRLLQILSNLTSNAIKFTAQGGIRLNLRLVAAEPARTPDARSDTAPVRATPEPEPLELRFEVIDSGIGIATADALRLFTDFTQLDTTSSKVFGGTGLGLSISRQLADLLGGRIGVEPNPAGGSIFWFTIRCQPADEAAGRRGADEREENRFRRARGRFTTTPPVLLVDDNLVNQTVSARLLEMLGCRVDVAPNGFEALRRLADAAAPPYAVVLMDIQMP
ncbi:MAG: PAS domain S-box protein, partial [Hymenobacteraceae bacterium]|nr:PAS domain S-box protein [Hymenobacteraceae bacterium]